MHDIRRNLFYMTCIGGVKERFKNEEQRRISILGNINRYICNVDIRYK